MKPFFSDKRSTSKTISLIENDEIISEDKEVAETLNTYFSNAVKTLDIKEVDFEYRSENSNMNQINKIIYKFKNHPSIIEIKRRVVITNNSHSSNHH